MREYDRQQSVLKENELTDRIMINKQNDGVAFVNLLQ